MDNSIKDPVLMTLEERTSYVNADQDKQFKRFVTSYYEQFGWTVKQLDGNYLEVSNVVGEHRLVFAVARPHEEKPEVKEFNQFLKDKFTLVTPEYSYVLSYRASKSYNYRKETASGITFYHFNPR